MIPAPRPVDVVFPIGRRLKDMGNCPFCGEPIDHNAFTSEISRKEFTISGMCQPCQDDFFNTFEYED